MLDKLFKWHGDWEQAQMCPWSYTFWNVVLVRDIGPFKAGSTVLRANVDFKSGRLSLSNNIVHTQTFDMHVVLVPVRQ
jgi:hypothetical protein